MYWTSLHWELISHWQKLVLFSSSDELGSYPLRRLERSSAAAISSGVFSSSEMTSSSSGWLDSLYRGFNELVDWEVLTSLDTEGLVILEGISSVLFRKNEWDLVERAWGLLLLDGMILTRSNIQRHRECNYASEVRGKSLWMTFQQRCYQSKAKQDRCRLVYKLNKQSEWKQIGSRVRVKAGCRKGVGL